MRAIAKLLTALMLGAIALPLLFLLGEGVRIPLSVPGARLLKITLFLAGMGAYFLLCAFGLALADPRPLLRLWPVVVALNLPLLVFMLDALRVEQNKIAVAPVALAWLVGVVCTCAGAAFGWRAKRP